MIFKSLVAFSDAPKQQLQLRFHQGSGEFSQHYFMIGDSHLFQSLSAAITYAFTGHCEGQNFQLASLGLADEAGNLWEIKRKYDRIAILKNRKQEPLGLPEVLSALVQADGDSQLPNCHHFAIGHYLLEARDSSFVVSPLRPHQEHEQAVSKFISEHSQSILEACALSMESKAYGKHKNLLSLAAALEPLYSEYQELHGQLAKLYQDKATQPRATQLEVETLKEQLSWMEAIDKTTQEILQANPQLEEQKRQLISLEEQIRKNLADCQLESVPQKHVAADWNIALQCLCYINVLDKLIPLAEQSLNHFNQHLQLSLQAFGGKAGEMLNTLEAQLSQCQSLLGLALPQTAASEGISKSWRRLLPGKKKVATSLRASPPQALRQATELLGQLLASLKGLDASSAGSAFQPHKLEEFLRQSCRKRDTLRQHWKQLCTELPIPENISLHDFLQFILKYNELFILEQKAYEIKEHLKKRQADFQKLALLLQHWSEKTGSQKIINLENAAILLSEAQNVVRYKKEKENKLNTILALRLDIETNYKREGDLKERLADVSRQWAKVLKTYELPAIEAHDARLKPLFEKTQLLKALDYLQHHLGNWQSFSEFVSGANHEALYLWRIPLFQQSQEQGEQLLSCLRSLPVQASHLLLCRDPDLANYLKRRGFGQILELPPGVANVSATNQPPSAVPRQRPPTLAEPRMSSPMPVNGQEAPRPKAPPTASLSPLTPKAQAVLDLLTGGPLKGH